MELRLGREQPADGDAVEAAGELVVTPRLDAVRPAEPMELGVRGNELVVDPPVRAARIGAAAYDVHERGVDAHIERPLRAPQ